MRSHGTDWEKIFTINVWHRTSRIYKESYNAIRHYPIKEWTKSLNWSFTKEDKQMANKHKKSTISHKKIPD